MLDWIIWNRIICIKMDLTLNGLQRLICHKTQPTNNQSKHKNNDREGLLNTQQISKIIASSSGAV